MMKGVNYRGIVTGKAVDREGAVKKIKMKESNDSSVSEQKVCKIKCVMIMMVSMLLNVSILIFYACI